jgi:hypothetical protein
MNHIKIADQESHSWCDEIIGVEFHFKDIEQAALNGIYGTKTVCGKCLERIIQCLDKNKRAYGDS